MNEERYGESYYNNQGGQPVYNQQGYAEPENQDYGYPNQQGYGQQYYGEPENQDYSYPNQQENMQYQPVNQNSQPVPDDNGKADDGKFKKKWIIIISCIILVIAAIIVALVLYFNSKKTAQEAYRNLLTDLYNDPGDFFSQIGDLDGYDMTDLDISEDEFSITDTDGDSVPELVLNITSVGKGNSFALVYDYSKKNGAQLRGLMKSDPEFYSDGTVVTKADDDGSEITLIEEYDADNREYAPLVRYYESDEEDVYVIEQYENDGWNDAETYTYDELTELIDNILEDIEKLVLDYEQITEENINNIIAEDSADAYEETNDSDTEEETEVTINIGETVDSGTCGDNVTWTLDDNGNLIIEGTGKVDDYDFDSDVNAPWLDERDSIKVCVIRDGVTSIGEDAFRYCESLISITIPDSVTSIGDWAFWGCSSLTSIKVESGNKNYRDIDGVLFNKNKTELICYPEGKTGTSYTIPDSVTSIGDYAFTLCNSLTSITIPDSVTSIGDYAFNSCSSLTSITIPDSVTSIGDWAFDGCTSLTSVTIPDSVTSIGDWAFWGCSSLTDVYYGGSEGDRDNIEIGDYNSKLTDATWHYNYNG